MPTKGNRIYKFRANSDLATEIEQAAQAMPGLTTSEVIRACVRRALPYVREKIQQSNPGAAGQQVPNETVSSL